MRCGEKATVAANVASAALYCLAVQPESATMHSPNHGRFLLDFSPARRGYFFALARPKARAIPAKAALCPSIGIAGGRSDGRTRSVMSCDDLDLAPPPWRRPWWRFRARALPSG